MKKIVAFFSELAYNYHSVCVVKRIHTLNPRGWLHPIQFGYWKEHYNGLYVERQLKSQNKHDSINGLISEKRLNAFAFCFLLAKLIILKTLDSRGTYIPSTIIVYKYLLKSNWSKFRAKCYKRRRGVPSGDIKQLKLCDRMGTNYVTVWGQTM